MELTRKRFQLSFFAFLILAFVGPAASAQTGKPATPPDQQNLLEALIQEVRQLRITLERTSVTSFRAQIAVERLRAQQDVVSRIGRDLEQVRQQLVQFKAETSRITESLGETEKKVETGVLSPEQFKEAKWHLERMKSQEDALRDRETSLTNQLTTETNKLSGLNQRLDMLEVILESVQNLDPPKKEKKKD